MLWAGVRLTRLSGLAYQGRYQTHPHLSRLSLGEWIQRAVQWHATPRSSECRVVPYHRSSENSHRQMAQAIQSYPATSGPQHASTSATDSIRKWPIGMGLYKVEKSQSGFICAYEESAATFDLTIIIKHQSHNAAHILTCRLNVKAAPPADKCVRTAEIWWTLVILIRCLLRQFRANSRPC